jgi:hypothetical protein
LKNCLDLLVVDMARSLQIREAFTEKPSSRIIREMTTMKTTTTTGLKVKSTIKAGGIQPPNHNRSGLKVKTAIKAGGIQPPNHNRSGLKVKSAIKAGGGMLQNHNRSGLKVKSAIKAGPGMLQNHNKRLMAS